MICILYSQHQDVLIVGSQFEVKTQEDLVYTRCRDKEGKRGAEGTD